MNSTTAIPGQNIQTQPCAAQGMALPDASDQASCLTGYNINDYVFGNLNNNDSYVRSNTANTTAVNPNVTDPVKNKKSKPVLGLLSLAALGAAAYIGIKKGKGEKINIPKFETIKSGITDFLKKFKKTKNT